MVESLSGFSMSMEHILSVELLQIGRCQAESRGDRDEANTCTKTSGPVPDRCDAEPFSVLRDSQGRNVNADLLLFAKPLARAHN